MFEEFDYSEEYRREPSESASAEWVRCLVSGMRPGYEDVKKMAAKGGKAPYYPGSPYLTEIRQRDGSELIFPCLLRQWQPERARPFFERLRRVHSGERGRSREQHPVGGSDDAHIDLVLAISSQPFNLTLLQHAQ
mgnify:CR=1 FL=1